MFQWKLCPQWVRSKINPAFLYFLISTVLNFNINTYLKALITSFFPGFRNQHGKRDNKILRVRGDR